VLHIERENFGVGNATWPGNAMEESAAIKNIMNVSCRLSCLLNLRSSPRMGLLALRGRSEESNNAGG